MGWPVFRARNPLIAARGVVRPWWLRHPQRHGFGPGLSYQWRASQQPLANGGHYSGVNTPDLTINSATLSQLNLFSCLVSNACGSVASPGTQLRVRCWVNCDGNTSSPLLSAEDFQCYLNEFAAGNSYANCDGSTAPPILNINDFCCFLNKYAARDCN